MIEHLKWLLALPFLGWWYKARQDRKNRDTAVFQRLDAVQSEEQLMWFLDQGAGAWFKQESVSTAGAYIHEAEKAKNDYLDSRLREAHGAYLSALGHLLRFISPRVVPGRGTDTFQFLPDKNIDVRGRAEDMDEFDREYRELLNLSDQVEVSYKRWRRLVSQRLHA